MGARDVLATAPAAMLLNHAAADGSSSMWRVGRRGCSRRRQRCCCAPRRPRAERRWLAAAAAAAPQLAFAMAGPPPASCQPCRALTSSPAPLSLPPSPLYDAWVAGNYIDHKCPFTGNVSIRGRILSGKVRRRCRCCRRRCSVLLGAG